VLLFFGADLAFVVCGLLFVRSYRHAYVGVAQIQEYEVSSAVNGTIKSVHVRLYDDVKAGDVLATLDDTRVRAMIATAQARVKQLQGQLDAARSEILQGRGTGQATFVTDLRRFQAAEENRRLEALSLRASVASVEIEAERLGLETKRAKELLALGLLSQAEYDAQRLRYEGTQRQLQESRGMLERTETDRNAAEARRADFERQQPLLASSSTLLPLRSAVEVETRARPDRSSSSVPRATGDRPRRRRSAGRRARRQYPRAPSPRALRGSPRSGGRPCR